MKQAGAELCQAQGRFVLVWYMFAILVWYRFAIFDLFTNVVNVVNNSYLFETNWYTSFKVFEFLSNSSLSQKPKG